MNKITLCGLALALCFLCTPAQAAEPEPIKIGAVFSVTGSNAFLGEPEKNAAEMAVETINRQGGLLGRQIQLIILDDESDVTKTVMAVGRLISKDQVVAVLGPTGTGNTLAVAPKMRIYKVPLISCASAEKITTPILPWVFKVAPSDRFAVVRLLEHITARGGSKVAILTASDGYGQAGRSVLKELIPAKGLTLLADEVYGTKDTDMTPQLTKINRLNPDAIICWGTNPGPAMVSRNRRQLGITIPIYMNHGVASHKFIDLAGASAEGVMLPAGRLVVADQLALDDPQRELLVEFKSGYEKTFASEVSAFSAHGWDAVMVVAKAIELAGSADPSKIRDALERVRGMIGIYGIFDYGPDNHTGLDERAFVMLLIEDGNWKIMP